MSWDSNPGLLDAKNRSFRCPTASFLQNSSRKDLQRVSRRLKIPLPWLYPILIKSNSPGMRLRCLWLLKLPGDVNIQPGLVTSYLDESFQFPNEGNGETQRGERICLRSHSKLGMPRVHFSEASF